MAFYRPIPVDRWTSRLGLDRATSLEELSLETEPEWRLYEDLRARRISFRIKPGRVSLVDPDDPAGRAQFLIKEGPVIRYVGAAGFLLKLDTGHERYLPRIEDVLRALSEPIV